ncbi:WD domain G-beta repeat domain containing protein [Plasmodium ovale wallikeri]|uniref:WD domain G-beta repeat domain containing protein n=2 Tax=Plasmodium ovale TaxID=36330 RepID=A0A1A8ZJ64_PLAOA|nr:WD domain G-beta repeat domain containing protein [Plasmodium ovale wallikeri]SBT43879.1 WD domain G-beta repeat domain containing protein [Plasmodium ovale wallikeri]SBT78500.1 WD repeat-containing protein, putative [Plasmodium ovale]
MNDSDTKKFRNISEKIRGKYIPVIKFGGTNKYINKNYKNDYDDTNNVSFTGDDFNSSSTNIYYDNKYGINRVCFSPQGKYVAGCGSNGIIYVYDLYENKLVTKICTRMNSINDLTISDNDKYIYACGDNRIIEVFDIYQDKKICNEDYTKYVDVSIPSIIKNKNNAIDKTLDTNDSKQGQSNNSVKKNILDNVYIPHHKVKHKDFRNNKVVYVPIYSFNDLINYDVNMIDLNCVKLKKMNRIINKSIFLIKDSHEYSTSCLAIPNISSFLIYSGGGDGLLKIWDVRMNMFTLSKKGYHKSMTDAVFLDNKNPYASICSHEDILTSINFDNTIDHENSSKWRKKRKERRKKEKKEMHKMRICNKESFHTKHISPCGEEKCKDFDTESLDEGKDNIFCNEDYSSSSFSSNYSSVSYSSLTFDLTKNKFNNILMTSGYDGYIRLYDINNNIIKSFYDEEKSITHCMFSSNNKYIISTNKSKCAKIFDFIYVNNKKNTKNMITYLTNYKSYCLNNSKRNRLGGREEKDFNDDGKLCEDNFLTDIYNDDSFQPCNIKNIYEDEDLQNSIKIVNELNKKITNDEKKMGNSNICVNEKIADSDCTHSNSDSSAYDENAIKTNTFYEHVNKKLEPTWSLFVDNSKYMNLIPYEDIHQSLKRNHEYSKMYYTKLNGNNDKNSFDNNDVEAKRNQLSIDENEHMLYHELSDIIYSDADIPKFYSCIAGDKCIIPAIDTYAHVYDIYTGFHVNTINNLYLPNYNVDNSYFHFHDLNSPILKRKHLSFLTSVHTYPKNQNIIATSNGYPDGSIVLWVFTPF